MDGPRQLLAVIDRLLEGDVRLDLAESSLRPKRISLKRRFRLYGMLRFSICSRSSGERTRYSSIPSAKPVAALADAGHAAQDAGQVQLVVVAVIEVPGQPRGDLPAVDLHDVALPRGLADLHDARVQGRPRRARGTVGTGWS